MSGVVAHQHVSIGEHAVPATVTRLLERTEAPGATAGPRVAVVGADAAADARVLLHPRHRSTGQKRRYGRFSLACNGNKNRAREAGASTRHRAGRTATASSS